MLKASIKDTINVRKIIDVCHLIIVFCLALILIVLALAVLWAYIVTTPLGF